MKKLVRTYVYYGKFSGESLHEEFTIEDTIEDRKEFLEEYRWDDLIEGDEEDFIAGKCNEIVYHTYGGDWDDPTGGRIEILSYEEAFEELQQNYKQDMRELKSRFDIID